MTVMVEIEHGTPKGYGQHRRHKVLPTCGPCRKAHSEKEAADAKRRADERAQRWNGGLVGKGRAGRTVPVGRDCPAAGCGTPASEPKPATGMVRVAVTGSREPARWYCAGGCAAYGQALGEVRAIGGGA
jgi:hypothetical protein